METALALEKLFPKQCQVLGIVTPGIVGEKNQQLDDFLLALMWGPLDW